MPTACMPTSPSVSCTRFSKIDASPLKLAEQPACADGLAKNASRCMKTSCESSASPMTVGDDCDPLP
jgi:hypothetical protein